MRKIVTILVILLSTSCSLKLREAQIDIPSEYIYADGFYQNDEAISERWWESFGDSTLNRLIITSLRQNRSLAAAASSVEASRHYLKVARAEFLPSLNGEAIAELTHEEQTTEQEYTIAPMLSWEVSLFGELRNTKRATKASLLQTQWNFRGVWLSLTAEVATSYFTLLQYQRNLYIATRSYELRQEATALVDSLFRYGMRNGTDLMQAKSLVYASKIEMQRYQRAVAATSLSLSALIGELPHRADWEDSGRALITDELPFTVPVGLPSSLLENRPDVMKSYFAMAKAAAEVGISRAQRFPTISISGNGGVFATSLKGLTSGDPLLWSATGELTAPIFSWGALRRKELMKREEYEASVKSYEQSIIDAISDVEKALITIETYSGETAASTALVLANTKILGNTTALYKSGLGDYLSVIDAERELYSSQISLVEVVAQQYINYVDLFKALGGGW